jgi:aminomethyltransferase
MEAGMPLYGHELTENVDPLTAELGWAVDLSKDFIGAEALRNVKEAGLKKKLVGLELEGKRIARQGSAVLFEGSPVGEVTSGTLSPTLGKSIAMAYVDTDRTGEGTALAVDLKGSTTPAKVVKLPFYKRQSG